jgi:hypothetical protein
MALMYIGARDHRPLPPPPEPWRPNLRPFVPIAVAVPMLIAAPMVPPLASYGLTVGAGVLICRTAARLLPSGDGLRDHRQ